MAEPEWVDVGRPYLVQVCGDSAATQAAFAPGAICDVGGRRIKTVRTLRAEWAGGSGSLLCQEIRRA